MNKYQQAGKNLAKAIIDHANLFYKKDCKRKYINTIIEVLHSYLEEKNG